MPDNGLYRLPEVMPCHEKDCMAWLSGGEVCSKCNGTGLIKTYQHTPVDRDFELVVMRFEIARLESEINKQQIERLKLLKQEYKHLLRKGAKKAESKRFIKCDDPFCENGLVAGPFYKAPCSRCNGLAFIDRSTLKPVCSDWAKRILRARLQELRERSVGLKDEIYKLEGGFDPYRGMTTQTPIGLKRND